MKNKGGGMPLWPLLLLVTYLVLPVLASLNGNKPNSTIVDHDNNHTVSTPVASATTWSVYLAPTAILCTLDDSDIAAGSRLFCGTATARSTITSSATSTPSPTSTSVVPPVAGAPESAGRHARTYDDAYENLSDDDLIRLVSAFDSDPSAFQRADLPSRSAAKGKVKVDETLLDTSDSSCHPQAQRVAGFGIGPVRGYTVECALNREIVNEDRQPEPDPLHILAAILIERAEAYRRGEAEANSAKATAWSVSEASRKAKAVFDIEAAKVADTYQIQLSELEASRKQQAESDVVYAQNVKKQAALKQEWSEVNALKGELKEQVALAKSNVAETQKIRVRAVLAAFPEDLAFEVPYAYSTTPTTGAPCLYQQLFSDPLSTLCNLQATTPLAPAGDVLEVRQKGWLGIQKLYQDLSNFVSILSLDVTMFLKLIHAAMPVPDNLQDFYFAAMARDSLKATLETVTVHRWSKIRFSGSTWVSSSDWFDSGLKALHRVTVIKAYTPFVHPQINYPTFSWISFGSRLHFCLEVLHPIVSFLPVVLETVDERFPAFLQFWREVCLEEGLRALDMTMMILGLLVVLVECWMWRKVFLFVFSVRRNPRGQFLPAACREMRRRAAKIEARERAKIERRWQVASYGGQFDIQNTPFIRHMLRKMGKIVYEIRRQPANPLPNASRPVNRNVTTGDAVIVSTTSPHTSAQTDHSDPVPSVEQASSPATAIMPEVHESHPVQSSQTLESSEGTSNETNESTTSSESRATLEEPPAEDFASNLEHETANDFLTDTTSSTGNVPSQTSAHNDHSNTVSSVEQAPSPATATMPEVSESIPVQSSQTPEFSDGASNETNDNATGTESRATVEEPVPEDSASDVTYETANGIDIGSTSVTDNVATDTESMGGRIAGNPYESDTPASVPDSLIESLPFVELVPSTNERTGSTSAPTEPTIGFQDVHPSDIVVDQIKEGTAGSSLGGANAEEEKATADFLPAVPTSIRKEEDAYVEDTTSSSVAPKETHEEATSNDNVEEEPLATVSTSADIALKQTEQGQTTTTSTTSVPGRVEQTRVDVSTFTDIMPSSMEDTSSTVQSGVVEEEELQVKRPTPNTVHSSRTEGGGMISASGCAPPEKVHVGESSTGEITLTETEEDLTPATVTNETTLSEIVFKPTEDDTAGITKTVATPSPRSHAFTSIYVAPKEAREAMASLAAVDQPAAATDMQQAELFAFGGTQTRLITVPERQMQGQRKTLHAKAAPRLPTDKPNSKNLWMPKAKRTLARPTALRKVVLSPVSVPALQTLASPRAEDPVVDHTWQGIPMQTEVAAAAPPAPAADQLPVFKVPALPPRIMQPINLNTMMPMPPPAISPTSQAYASWNSYAQVADAAYTTVASVHPAVNQMPVEAHTSSSSAMDVDVHATPAANVSQPPTPYRVPDTPTPASRIPQDGKLKANSPGVRASLMKAITVARAKQTLSGTSRSAGPPAKLTALGKKIERDDVFGKDRPSYFNTARVFKPSIRSEMEVKKEIEAVGVVEQMEVVMDDMEVPCQAETVWQMEAVVEERELGGPSVGYETVGLKLSASGSSGSAMSIENDTERPDDSAMTVDSDAGQEEDAEMMVDDETAQVEDSATMFEDDAGPFGDSGMMVDNNTLRSHEFGDVQMSNSNDDIEGTADDDAEAMIDWFNDMAI
ncbi:hypothetical protein QFC21_004361 [Naganishia friedmannii]|uniref:Uncharacterized protein n=1 Tax=Naganishia friedmannii TaxID=89922 RepID=A0ACC2VHV7_9TREE|nr:hypothetical protein QFC21_004361 [Naganishia friedmannii]